MCIVRKEHNQTIIKNTSVRDFCDYCKSTGAKNANENKIIPFYVKSSTPNILRGFFAKKIILVEGMTEELSLPIYFEKVGLDVLKEGIDVISVGGKGETAKWWRLFTHFGIPTYIIFDNDQKDDSNSQKRKDILVSIGITTEDDVDKIISTSDCLVDDKFCVFGKDFETTLRNKIKSYQDIENQIKQEFRDSKPLVAREVAKNLNLEEQQNEEGLNMFNQIKDAILKLND